MKSLDTIMDLVAVEFGVTREQLLGRDGHKNIADAKQAMVMVARHAGWTVMELGQKIGRDHTVVSKRSKAGSNKHQTDFYFRRKVDRVKAAISKANCCSLCGQRIKID